MSTGQHQSEHPERSALKPASLRELLRALASTAALTLTDAQRVQLTRMVEHHWQDEASCISQDPVSWYPAEESVPLRQVTRTCAGCPVRRSCLATALLWNEDGIWAGTDSSHRREGYRLLEARVTPAAVVQMLLARATPDTAYFAPATKDAVGVERLSGTEAA